MTYHWEKDRIEFLFTMLGEAFEKGFVTHKYGLPPAKVLRIMLITFNQKYPSEEELTVQKLRNKFSLLSNAYKRYEDSFSAAEIPEQKWLDPDSWSKLETSPHRFPKFRKDDFWWFYLMHQSMRGKVILENGERLELNWMIDPYVNHSPEPSTPNARDESLPNSYGDSPIKNSRDLGSSDLHSDSNLDDSNLPGSLPNPAKIPKIHYDPNPFMRLKHDPLNRVTSNDSATKNSPNSIQMKQSNAYHHSSDQSSGFSRNINVTGIDAPTDGNNDHSGKLKVSYYSPNANNLSPNRDYGNYPRIHSQDRLSPSNSSTSGQNSPSHGHHHHVHLPSSDRYNNDHSDKRNSRNKDIPKLGHDQGSVHVVLDKIASNLHQMTSILSSVGGVGNHANVIEEKHVDEAMKVIQGMGLNPMSFLKAFNLLKDPINAKAFCALETKNRIVYLQASGVLSDTHNNFDHGARR